MTVNIGKLVVVTGFSGAGKTGDYHQFVAGNFNVDILEIMLPRSFDENILGFH